MGMSAPIPSDGTNSWFEVEKTGINSRRAPVMCWRRRKTLADKDALSKRLMLNAAPKSSDNAIGRPVNTPNIW